MRSPAIYASLRAVPSWEEAATTARLAFVEEMRGREYGHEPLLDAWLWFVSGWNARYAHSPSPASDGNDG